MPKPRLDHGTTAPRHIGAEDEDQQSQLVDGKRDKRGPNDDVSKDAER